MTSDILKRAAEAEAMPLIGAWNICKFQENSRTLIPDMAAAIAERDAEIERLTARAEAAEAREAALLAANDVNRKLMLDRNAELARWKKMADRLAGAATPFISPVQTADFARQIREYDALCAALSAHAAMKEGR